MHTECAEIRLFAGNTRFDRSLRHRFRLSPPPADTIGPALVYLYTRYVRMRASAISLEIYLFDIDSARPSKISGLRAE